MMHKLTVSCLVAAMLPVVVLLAGGQANAASTAEQVERAQALRQSTRRAGKLYQRIQ